MRILVLADEEVTSYWDFFRKEDFEGIDLIISCGDLSAAYLSFLTTMTAIPLYYIHGNHDDRYKQSPPEGCICIEDTIVKINGVRILGLGGCMRYNRGINQYTNEQMAKRIKKLRFKIWQKGGVDLLVTHSPALGIHDGEDLCHKGFACFHTIYEKYKPKYHVHGHLHLSYGHNFSRVDQVENTTVINAFEKYIIEI